MSEKYTGPERRGTPPAGLTEEQINHIAERAADLAVQRVIDMGFKVVGKSVVEKFVWIVGALAVGGYMYLQSRGIIK